MRQKYIIKPFGVDGETASIPDLTQSDGSISWQQGWGVDYQRQKGTDPLYKPIERTSTNGLFNALSDQVKQYQEFGFPEFITTTNNGGTAFSYDYGAIVRYSATGLPPFTTYISMVTGNTYTPGTDATKWKVFNPATIFTPAPSLLSANGYRYYPAYPGDPTPLIEQWGTAISNSSGDATITFPVPFPTSVYTLISTYYSPTPSILCSAVTILNLSNANIHVTNPSGVILPDAHMMWVAKGI